MKEEYDLTHALCGRFYGPKKRVTTIRLDSAVWHGCTRIDDRFALEFPRTNEELRVVCLILKKQKSEPLDDINLRTAELGLTALHHGINRVLLSVVG